MLRTPIAMALLISSISCVDRAGEKSSVSISPSDGRAQIEFYNRCDHDVTFGRMGQGDIATLRPEQRNIRDLGPDDKAYTSIAYYGFRPGRFPGGGHMTLAEFTFNTFNKMDFYDISLVDGYNIGMKIVNRGNTCRPGICGGDILNTCPASQKMMRDSQVISCTKWNDKDNPNNPAARHFERKCENAYSWSKDDAATVGCDAQDYIVTFCPYR